MKYPNGSNASKGQPDVPAGGLHVAQLRNIRIMDHYLKLGMGLCDHPMPRVLSPIGNLQNAKAILWVVLPAPPTLHLTANAVLPKSAH
jgi:hypothetical protein